MYVILRKVDGRPLFVSELRLAGGDPIQTWDLKHAQRFATHEEALRKRGELTYRAEERCWRITPMIKVGEQEIVPAAGDPPRMD